MKTFFGCTTAAALAFLFMGLQTGLFVTHPVDSETEVEGEEAPPTAVVQKKKRAKFPEDLAPAARAKPVAAAAEYRPSDDKAHKLVCLKVSGGLHPWQEDVVSYSEEWAAGNVEETELVLVVAPQVRKTIQKISFVNGPPVERNQWEVEISVVEAKSGKVLGNRSFVNIPRPIRNLEEYELTALGSPVKYLHVFNWLQNQARAGFPNRTDTSPIIITNR